MSLIIKFLTYKEQLYLIQNILRKERTFHKAEMFSCSSIWLSSLSVSDPIPQIHPPTPIRVMLPVIPSHHRTAVSPLRMYLHLFFLPKVYASIENPFSSLSLQKQFQKIYHFLFPIPTVVSSTLKYYYVNLYGKSKIYTKKIQ